MEKYGVWIYHDDVIIFPVTGQLYGEFSGDRWIPLTKDSDAEFLCFFGLRMNKRLSKQSTVRWFERPLRSLWRHCNGKFIRGPVTPYGARDLNQNCLG